VTGVGIIAVDPWPADNSGRVLGGHHEDSGFNSGKRTFKIYVPKCDIAMDGNRDDSITFGDTNDNHYLFWVNDDVDVISGGEEDDAQSGTANCNDSAITCKRDLEDFTRLHIKVDDTTANLSGITYFLKFENVSSGSPSVNIFEAVGESSTYLSDTSVAAQQIQKTKLITVGTTEVQLPNQHIKTADQVSPFILEGKTAGKGDLTLIVKMNGNEVCKKAMSLDLRPITEFYEKYVVTVIADDNVNTNSGSNANSTTYTPENDEYVLHVHGWNMEGWEKDRWSETVFKRLWWQRYKGHVGGFQWPTYTGILTYDASEVRAWRSGEALKNRITSLNSTYSGEIRVIAHSMGNVVMGEALRLFSSSVVHTYIAAQAAIPAHCYDNTVTNYWTGFDTPNIYARYSSGLSPDTPYLAANSSHVGAMALYFNPVDYALGAIAWQLNNEMKPDLNYWYTEGDSNVDSYAPASGDRFYYDSLLPFDERTMTIPDDRFETFARIVESRSRALGSEPSVNGFGTARDLRNWGYNNQHYSHSREFRSNIVDERPFWTAVVEDAQLNQ
ncbi:MAG: alpha/beta hydrolase, partial [Candidatus Eisenbacteria bacterium]|nr:alpha/beta hydrolase [Candidatus Eisenbacteria bacterium]